jgi:hypothetical protein
LERPVQWHDDPALEVTGPATTPVVSEAPALAPYNATGLLPGTLPPDGLLPDRFDPRGSDGDRLVTQIREQAVGDPRCTAYALASMMEAWLCRKYGTRDGVPFLRIGDIFTGTEELIVNTKQAAASTGVSVDGYPIGSTPDPGAPTRFRLRPKRFTQALEARPLAMCRSIVLDGPLVLTLRIFDDFDAFRDKPEGAVYAPGPSALALDMAHALCVIGFDQVTRTWLVRNSNSAWGRHGYANIEWSNRLMEPEAKVVGAVEVKPI